MPPHRPHPARRNDAPPLAALVAARCSRRAALGGLLAAGLAAALPRRLLAAQGAPAALDFDELPAGLHRTHAVARRHVAQVLLPWGDPVRAGLDAFDPLALTADEQEGRVGQGHDFLAFLPLPYGSGRSDHGLLWINHEQSVTPLMFASRARAGEADREQTGVELAAQGGTVVELALDGGRWRRAGDGRYDRRVTARSTECRVSGPAAGHARLRTAADPSGRRVIGTMSNCAGGVTPWGTVLTCEENIHHHFGGDPTKTPEARSLARYEFPVAYPYGWHRTEPRFDVEREPREPNRFGWVVEVDPYDPFAAPVKRTALGRLLHEGATCAPCPDGRLAVYTGDDSKGEYLFKFVTARPVDARDRSANRDLLDAGTLHVARLEADGTGRWLPLVHGAGPLTAANGFGSQADVVIDARLAADLLGATPLDRPEDVEVSPVTGAVYVALTNNSRRGTERGDPVDAANPRATNLHGHLLELLPPGGPGASDHAALEFRWELPLLAGPPEGAGARYGPGTTEHGWFSCPDNLAFDPAGRLWIATDGNEDRNGRGDGLFACAVDGEGRATTRHFFSVPTGAELCGPCFTPDGTTLFLAVQHPGRGSRWESPSTRWPDFDDALPPRPAVVAVRREDGGPIGGAAG